MRILVADADPNVRFALRALLEQQAGVQVVAEAGSLATLLDKARSTCPDVMLLDWGLGGLTPVDLLSDLREACLGLAVIALSGRSKARQAALAAGADGFVCKTDSPEELLSAVQSVQRAGNNG